MQAELEETLFNDIDTIEQEYYMKSYAGFNGFLAKDLKDQCKTSKIRGYSKMNKHKLIEALILNHDLEMENKEWKFEFAVGDYVYDGLNDIVGVVKEQFINDRTQCYTVIYTTNGDEREYCQRQLSEIHCTKDQVEEFLKRQEEELQGEF